MKEIKAPDSYAQSDVIHKVDVEAGKTVTITATDERVKGAVHIKKIDKENTGLSSNRETVPLQEPCMVCNAREDIVHPDGKTGVLFKKTASSRRG